MEIHTQWRSTLCSFTHAVSNKHHPVAFVTFRACTGKKELLSSIVCRSFAGESSSSVLIKETERSAAEDVVTVDLKTSEMGLSDTSLESNNEHRFWVFVGCSALLDVLLKSVAATVESPEALGLTVLSALSGYVLADLASGIYHWGIDNYGDADTFLFGPQIDAFQGHHRRPWTITKREFANNIHSLARPATFFLLPALLLPSNAPLDAFLAVSVGCVVFSQQFHAWAHMRRSYLHPIVAKLQDMGVLVSTRMHGKHHRAPYSSNYCIVSGICNRPLDTLGVFDHMERFIYLNWGYSPRCWADTSPKWMQEGSYFEDGTDSI